MRRIILSFLLASTLMVTPALAVSAEVISFFSSVAGLLLVECAGAVKTCFEEKQLAQRAGLAISKRCACLSCCGLHAFREYEHAIPGNIDSDKKEFVVNLGRILRKNTDKNKYRVYTDERTVHADASDDTGEPKPYNHFHFGTDYTLFKIRFYDQENDCTSISSKLHYSETRMPSQNVVDDIFQYIGGYLPHDQKKSDYFQKELRRNITRWIGNGKLEYIEILDSRFFVLDKAMILEITPSHGQLTGIDIERDDLSVTQSYGLPPTSPTRGSNRRPSYIGSMDIDLASAGIGPRELMLLKGFKSMGPSEQDALLEKLRPQPSTMRSRNSNSRSQPPETSFMEGTGETPALRIRTSAGSDETPSVEVPPVRTPSGEIDVEDERFFSAQG